MSPERVQAEIQAAAFASLLAALGGVVDPEIPVWAVATAPSREDAEQLREAWLARRIQVEIGSWRAVMLASMRDLPSGQVELSLGLRVEKS